jgi:hypothetical protein
MTRIRIRIMIRITVPTRALWCKIAHQPMPLGPRGSGAAVFRRNINAAVSGGVESGLIG